MKFELQPVEFMPKDLAPGVLYVSERYGTAAHLCACGCGEKVRTPLGPTEWRVTPYPDGPTLMPSVGNWQRPCRSHYFIINGGVEWATDWTDAQVQAGRESEDRRRRAHLEPQEAGFWLSLWRRIKQLLRL